MRVLTSDYRIITYSSSKYVSSTKEAPYIIESYKDLEFDTNTSMSHGFEFETVIKDGIEVGVTAVDQLKLKALQVFYMEHPQTIVNGRPHTYTKIPTFNILDLAQKTVEEAIDFDKEFEVVSSIKSMSLTEKRDVAYFFGHPPRERRMVS